MGRLHADKGDHMPVLFPAVQAVLNGIIGPNGTWTVGNGAPPDFLNQHGSPLDFSSVDKLLASTARGLPLIQPGLKGQQGLGHTANIVLALTVGAPRPVPPGGSFPQMPAGGLDSRNGKFLAPDSPEIKTIIQWIEDGCLP
jgi:hypothetical protein